MDKHQRQEEIEWWKTYGPGIDIARRKRGITFIQPEKLAEYHKLVKDVRASDQAYHPAPAMPLIAQSGACNAQDPGQPAVRKKYKQDKTPR